MMLSLLGLPAWRRLAPEGGGDRQSAPGLSCSGAPVNGTEGRHRSESYSQVALVGGVRAACCSVCSSGSDIAKTYIPTINTSKPFALGPRLRIAQ